MDEFYYVHNRKQGNPTFRHKDLESALNEAKRLSNKYKKNFYVLKPIKHVLYNNGNTIIESDREVVNE